VALEDLRQWQQGNQEPGKAGAELDSLDDLCGPFGPSEGGTSRGTSRAGSCADGLLCGHWSALADLRQWQQATRTPGKAGADRDSLDDLCGPFGPSGGGTSRETSRADSRTDGLLRPRAWSWRTCGNGSGQPDTRQAVAVPHRLDVPCGPFVPSEGEDIQGNQQGGQLRRWDKKTICGNT
jgi:hypothetical protein